MSLAVVTVSCAECKAEVSRQALDHPVQRITRSFPAPSMLQHDRHVRQLRVTLYGVLTDKDLGQQGASAITMAAVLIAKTL